MRRTRTRANKKHGGQWKVILDHALITDEEEEKTDAAIVQKKPSQVFVHQVPGSVLQPAQRSLSFNLNVRERDAFIASRPRTQLFEHQEAGIAFMRMRETKGHEIGGALGGIIRLPPRTGKTKTFIMHTHRDVQERCARGETRFGMPTLLIVPKNVTDTMTYENNDLFDDGCELFTRIVLSESQLQTTDLHSIIAQHDMIITSYSTLLAFYQRWTKSWGLCTDIGPRLMFQTKWRRVIADEAHRLANNRNIISDAVAALTADHFWYVTATPIQNAATDILSALRFVGVQDLFVQMANVPVLLASLAFQRDYDDLIKINPRFAQLKPPSRESMQRTIDFATESERALYKYIERQSFLHLKDTRLLEGERPANVFTEDIRPENMSLRMRQSCVSPWLLPSDFILPEGMRYADPAVDGELWTEWMESTLMGTPPHPHLVQEGWPSANVIPPMSSKEQWIMHYLRTVVEPRGEKIVIFSEWTSSLARLHEIIKTRAYMCQGHRRTIPEDGVVCINGTVKGPQRKQALRAMWEDSNKHILLVTLQSGGLGEDFTFANHSVLLDPWWTPATEFQALVRIIGLKQTRTVNIMVLCIGATVEDYVQARANEKRGFEAIMNVATTQNNDQGGGGGRAAVDEDSANDPMVISSADVPDGEDLLADPTEEPTFYVPDWMNGYLEQAIRQPVEVYDQAMYSF